MRLFVAGLCAIGGCARQASSLPADAASLGDAATVVDGSTPDGGPPADAPDADPAGSEATTFAIDPAHDNAQPNDTVGTPLKASWKVTFSGAVSYPLVVDGLVIVSVAEAEPNVRALDIKTGALVWGPRVFGKPVTLAYDGGHVFAIDADGYLTALDLATGARTWAIQLLDQSNFLSPPVATGGRIYLNGLGEGGDTSAVDEQTGSVLWDQATFVGSKGSVAVEGATVYEADGCDRLSAFDAVSGSLRWSNSTGCTGPGVFTPAAHDGFVWDRDMALASVIFDSNGSVVGSFASKVAPAFHGDTAFYMTSSTLSAVTISSNTLRWSFAGDGKLCTSAIVAGGSGQIFVGSQSGNLYELDEATGTQNSVDNLGTPITCSTETVTMALAENHLFVPAGNQLVVY